MVPDICVGIFPLGQKSSLKANVVSCCGMSTLCSSLLSAPLTGTFRPSSISISFSVWLEEFRLPGWYLQREDGE